jgi:hypothetical protein
MQDRPAALANHGARSALIVANYEYADPGLRRLRAPASDAEALAGVLSDPEIGGFEVRTLLNEPAHEVNLAVEEFFADRQPDDLLLVHFSCHGVKDEDGELYFASANTLLRRLGATAVAAEFVNRRMNRTRSRRVVLLLDCCYAGAFERGMTARAGTGVSIEERFGGRGRAVITASSAMEYAFEGDQLADSQELAPSVFTSALVEGLETGDADRDQDGMVALDELYDYVYDKVRRVTPNQTPGKWTFGVQGDLYIARRSRPVSTPAPLPPELQEAIDSPFAGVRTGAVQELQRLLTARHAGLALAARLALERLTDDDSRTVSTAATAALGTQARPAPPPESGAATKSETVPAAKLDGPRPQQEAPIPEASPLPTPTSQPAAAAEPAAPPASPDRRTPPPAQIDRGLLVSGGLAIVAAVLTLVGLFPEYYMGDGRSVWGSEPRFAWYLLSVAALASSAGICIFSPRTRRLIGPGILLGAVAVSFWVLLDIFIISLDVNGESVGPGFWLELVAGVVLVIAGCLAGLALARAGDARVVPRPPQAAFPRLVALLGVVGAVELPFIIPSKDFDPAHDWVPLVGLTAVALVVPSCAAVAVPRRFGVALLAGWIGAAAALLIIITTAFGAALLGCTLLAFLVVIIPFARDAGVRAVTLTE